MSHPAVVTLCCCVSSLSPPRFPLFSSRPSLPPPPLALCFLVHTCHAAENYLTSGQCSASSFSVLKSQGRGSTPVCLILDLTPHNYLGNHYLLYWSSTLFQTPCALHEMLMCKSPQTTSYTMNENQVSENQNLVTFIEHIPWSAYISHSHLVL